MAKGTVKFFDNNFGFITNEAGIDVFISLTTVRSARFKATDMIPGAKAEFEVKSTPKGFAVSKILSIDGKTAKNPGEKFQLPIVKPTLTIAGQRIVGSLKFYAPARCYGFIEIIDPPGYDDIFFHLDGVCDPVIKSELRREKMKKGTMVEGVVELFATSSDLGKMATKRPVILIDGFHNLHKKTAPLPTKDDSSSESAPKPLHQVGFMAVRSAQGF